MVSAPAELKPQAELEGERFKPRSREHARVSCLLGTLGWVVAHSRVLSARTVAAGVGRHPVAVRDELRELRRLGLVDVRGGEIVPTLAGVRAARAGDLT